MSAKVVTLGVGGCVAGPDEDVVERCRSLLEMAEKGEICGICVAWVDGGNSAWHSVTPGIASGNTLASAVSDVFFSVMFERNQAP